jgi:hypothetical protein
MNVNWLDPVTQLAILGGVLGLGLIGSLTLWISLKIDVRAAKKGHQAFRETTDAAIEELRGSMEAMAEAMKTAPAAEPAPAVPGVLNVQGLNLTNRTKALRMSRRGEPIPSIAASLGVAQEEIELLLKLERLLEVPAA